jgi:hypothetical protein
MAESKEMYLKAPADRVIKEESVLSYCGIKAVCCLKELFSQILLWL